MPEDNVIYHNSGGWIDLRFGNYNYQIGTIRSQDDKIESTLMTIEEEFTWNEMNKILNARYNELMLEMSHDQTIDVIEREYNTQYMDKIIEGNLF